jgi:hypothetical protein
MSIWLLIALAAAVPAAWFGGLLRGESHVYGSHSTAVPDSRRFAVPNTALEYNVATGRHEIKAGHGRHRTERDGTQWLTLGEQPKREDVFVNA